MERLNAHVGPADAALEQAPEVLQRVRVDLSVHVGDGVVDHLMRVLPGEPIVRPQVIAVERRARFDVLFHFAV